VIAVGVLAAALMASFGAAKATADASGTPVTTTNDTITNLYPTIVADPKLQLVSIRVSGQRVELKLLCTFAACEVNAGLTTIEHLRSGRATLLSAAGEGKHTRAVTVGSTHQSLKIFPGKTVTVTVTLNGTGVTLLHRFQRLPTRAAVELVDGAPVTTIHRTLELG
jgi:hypothetical protein